jgi:hypothetical protein
MVGIGAPIVSHPRRREKVVPQSIIYSRHTISSATSCFPASPDHQEPSPRTVTTTIRKKSRSARSSGAGQPSGDSLWQHARWGRAATRICRPSCGGACVVGGATHSGGAMCTHLCVHTTFCIIQNRIWFALFWQLD